MLTKRLSLLSVCFLLTGLSYATTLIITAGGSGFSPNTANINLGDTVLFQWSDGVHTTTSTTIPGGAAAWDEALDGSNTSFMYVPTVAGVYDYKCIPHESMGMIGTFTVNPSTGIEVAQQSLSVDLYPIPAHDDLNLSFAKPMSGSFYIADIIGRKITTQDFKETNQVKIDLSQLPNGVYFINIQSEEKYLIKKFSVSR
ncbi:MAG TPA: T9SS type A sorting domain-containing protein [Aquaticitalea sp.]|nr:T9SS type A sorting domain-containing protein [Aquaticitalea sp.]